MTIAENSASEPPNLKTSLGEYTLSPPYKARALGTRDNAPPPPPVAKKPGKPRYSPVGSEWGLALSDICP